MIVFDPGMPAGQIHATVDVVNDTGAPVDNSNTGQPSFITELPWPARISAPFTPGCKTVLSWVDDGSSVLEP